MWSSNMHAVDDTNSLQAYTAKKKKKNASESYSFGSSNKSNSHFMNIIEQPTLVSSTLEDLHYHMDSKV